MVEMERKKKETACLDTQLTRDLAVIETKVEVEGKWLHEKGKLGDETMMENGGEWGLCRIYRSWRKPILGVHQVACSVKED